jgi:large subunit ribosomal protein L43
MATRGVMQLTKLQLVYCEYGGSSAAMRDYIASGKIIDWARQHEYVDVVVQVQNGKHPLIRGEYKTGFPKQISVGNQSIHRIETVMDMLHNSSGRKMTQLKKPVITATPSIQGVWTPMLNLQDKQFQVTIYED